ncbi:hypothetical protein BGZ60DRAFT_430092 [Tricladium varicosporioides]|nr:hypothetical protein BGZ60DRAFT_430092 [Hymenoscyphus varicosporioides]
MEETECSQDASVSPGPTLPPGFTTISDVKNFSREEAESGKIFVNIIGFVKDFRVPKQTSRDWKCTIELKDASLQYGESHGVLFSFFAAQEAMLPAAINSSDVVLIRRAKLQFRGALELCSHWVTTVFVMPATEIPRDPSEALRVPWRIYSAADKPKGLRPNVVETTYVILANRNIGDLELPAPIEFEEKRIQSANTKEKFAVLKNVKEARFYDILGEVVRVYDNQSDRMDSVALYLTDYTANSHFYNYDEDDKELENFAGDEFGYVINNRPKRKEPWPGPPGKLTIQLTVYDHHAVTVREKVKVGDWVFIRNVRINYGKMGGLLEGFLHGSAFGDFTNKLQVEIMQNSEDRRLMDPRWKEALERKNRLRKRLGKGNLENTDDDADLGDKRKRGDENVRRNKKRRMEAKAAAYKKALEKEEELAKKQNLNSHVRCPYPDQPIVTIDDILNPKMIMKNANGQEVPSPFTLCNYRSNVRVVDYFPNKLEDFAVGHRATDLDMLSDYSGAEDTDIEEERRIFKSGRGFAKDAWEWRFALQVEDAEKPDINKRIWLMVDNHAAQALLNFEEDATSLRGNKELFNKLREQLFKLWGDLEEQKTAQLRSEKNADIQASSIASVTSSPASSRYAGDQPDADDSDMDNVQSRERSTGPRHRAGSPLKEKETNTQMTNNQGVAGKPSAESDLRSAPRNRPFTCCIKQYGVKVEEKDQSKADAGDGLRWQRMFGIFGTQIL